MSKDLDIIYYIYFLSHPISQEVRYVGLTNCVSRRFSEHISDANNDQCNFYKDKWVRSLLKQNLKPCISVVENFSSKEEAIETEKFYICYLTFLGARLTNLTEGGEGTYGWKPTEQQRANMRVAQQNKILPPESMKSLKKKVSDFNKGKKRSPEMCEKIRKSKLGDKNHNFGKKIPKRKLSFKQADEIRKYYLETNCSYTELSELYNLNLSSIINIINNKTYLTPNINNHRRKLTIVQANEIRNLFKEGVSRSELARRYGVAFLAINNIVNYKSYIE